MKKEISLGLFTLSILIVSIFFASYAISQDLVLKNPPFSSARKASSQSGLNSVVTPPAPICGDGQCQASENSISCSIDCIGFSGALYRDYYSTSLKYISSSYSANGAIDHRSPVVLDAWTSILSPHAITVGADGNPVMVYYNAANGDLKIGFCQNRFCNPNTFTSKVLYSSPGYLARDPSISINSQGNPVVAFGSGDSARDLAVVTCLDNECLNIRTEYLVKDTVSNILKTSLVIRPNDFAQIAYVTESDSGLNRLEFVSCQDVFCFNPPREVAVDTDVNEVSIMLGSDGNPMILYTKESVGSSPPTYDLMTYHCIDLNCVAPVASLNYDPVPLGGYSDKSAIDMMINVYGNPIFSYLDNNGSNMLLKVGTCNDVGCSLPALPQIIDSVPIYHGRPAHSSISRASVGIGSNKHPIIFYNDGEQSGLKKVECFDFLCQNPMPPTFLDTAYGSGTLVAADGISI